MQLFLKNTLLSFAVYATCVGTGFGQSSTEGRIEIDIKDGYENESCHPIGTNGLVIFAKSKKSEDGQYEYKYDFYGTDLKLQETKSEMVGKKLYSTHKIINEDGILEFFRGKKNTFTIIYADKGSKSFERVEGVFPKKFKFESIIKSEKSLLIVGRIKKEYKLLILDYKTGEYETADIRLPDNESLKFEILNFGLMEDKKEFFISLKLRIDRKHSESYMLVYSDKGELKDAVNVNTNEEVNLVSLVADHIGEDIYALTGTYSNNNYGTSIGIFFGKINKGKLEYLNTHLYTSFSNFFNYLPERQQAKIERKKEKAEAKGKELLYPYLMATHNILTLNEDYIYVGEAYYPTYRSEVTYNSKGQAQYRQVFDGYQYTHATIVCFDKQGNKKWDQIFELNPGYKPFYQKKFIRTIPGKNTNTVDLVYASYNKIVSKSINSDGNIVRDASSIPIETLNEDDKVKSSTSEVSYWYENYFLSYGTQKIKNMADRNTRRVFYFNKIKY